MKSIQFRCWTAATTSKLAALLIALLFSLSSGKGCYTGPTAGLGADAPVTRPLRRDSVQGSPIAVAMERGNDACFIRVHVADADAGWFLVDPAQPRILVDVKVAQRLRLPIARGSWGDASDLDSFAVRLEGMRLGAYEALPHLAIARDLTAWRDHYGVELSGVLGWPALAHVAFSIDFRAATLTILDPTTFVPPVAPAIEQPIRFVQGVPATLGTIDGSYTGWFAIRPGCPAPFRVSTAFLAAHPEMFFDTPRPPAALAPPGAETISRFESLQVMGQSVRPCLGQWQAAARTSTSTQLAPTQVKARLSGEIGGPLFRDLRMTFDVEGRRMWVEHLGEEEPRATLARLGGARASDLAGVTPLMRVAELGRADLAEMLIKAGADISATDRRGRTALMAGCQVGDNSVIKLLVSHGAAVNPRDGNGQTALMRAAACGAAGAASTLLQHGAEVDATDGQGLSALHYAAAANSPDVVDLLAERRADLNRQTSDGMTPLRAAVDFGSISAVETLLRRNAAVNTAKQATPAPSDREVRTPLVDAAAFGRAAAARLLIKAGADVNAVSSQKMTPLMWAAAFRTEGVVRLLLSSGSGPRLLSAESKTALDYALEAGDLEVANLIYAATNAHGAIGTGATRMRPGRTEVGVRRGGVEFFMPVSVGRQDAGWMLLDTGAPGITVDLALAEQLQLRTVKADSKRTGPSGVSSAKVVEIPAMQVGGVTVGPMLAYAEDFEALHHRRRGAPITCIGTPFPDQCAFTVDYVAGKVDFGAPDADPPAGAVRCPLQRVGNWFCVPMTREGDRGYFAVDSGAPAGFVLFPPYLSLHPEVFDGDARWRRRYSEWTDQGARAAFIDLGPTEGIGARDTRLRGQLLLTMPTSADRTCCGLIGGELLQHCRLTLDPPNGRAWVERARDDAPANARRGRPDAETTADLFHTPALLRAIYEADLGGVRALLQRGVNPDEADEDGTTPLLAACERGYEDFAGVLIDAGAKADSNGVIGAAARARLPHTVRRLIGQEQTRLTKENLTDLLICSVEGGDPTCVELALAAGADPNLPDSSGRLPVTLCASSQSEAVMAVLLKAKADMNSTPPDGRTALMLAARANQASTVRLLATNRAELNARDKDGWTALMCAAADAGPQVIQSLLNAGADPRLRNRVGRTAFDLAAEADNFENAECLYFHMAQARR